MGRPESNRVPGRAQPTGACGSRGKQRLMGRRQKWDWLVWAPGEKTKWLRMRNGSAVGGRQKQGHSSNVVILLTAPLAPVSLCWIVIKSHSLTKG